ncbi:hypothetical protein MNBD_GAMMA07-2704 [hydrothermal vent metagenome]|uniref:DUF1499 domain-containing protein n=1 Tax=hydrothermal vent metagenome TaxID=652676 RepID=A0A3B0WXU5_9ZZZZ
MSIFLLSCSGQKPKDLGIYNNTFSHCPVTPNCISSDATDKKHKIDFLKLNAEYKNNWQAIHNAVNTLSNTKIVTFNETYIHAECSSTVFGFVDDLQLHLRENGENIAIKSAARLGHSDFGVNKKRIEKLREQLLKDNVITE